MGTARPAADDAERRDRAIARGALSALGVRVLGMATGLVLVPLSIGYLGAERYGAWMTISSTIAWLQLADLGLGNGLTTALSEAHGQRRPEAARHHVSTAFWMLAAIALVGGLLFALAWPRVDWAGLFNVHSPLARGEIGGAVALVVALFLIGFPTAIADRIYPAYQEGALGNAWTTAASLVSLAAAFAATRTQGGLPAMVAALLGGRLAVQTANALWLFLVHRPAIRPSPAAFERGSVGRLSRIGGLFFLVQIAALVLFNTDNFIIARVLGAESVTPYAATWSLFTYPAMAITLYFPYLWPAYAEAIARGDRAWIRRTFRLSLWSSVAAALVLALPLVAFGRPIIRLWAGEVAVPALSLLGWMGAWSVVSAGMNAMACLLNAAGQVTGQAVYGTVTAALNVLLSILWARSYGITGVIAATVVAYLVCAVVPSAIETARLLARVAPEGR